MSKHAIRTLIAAVITAVGLIAAGWANADAPAGASAHSRDISPWTVTHGR